MLKKLVCMIALMIGVMLTANAADPLLFPLFADNAVIQRDIAAPIWGWAASEARVAVKLTDAAGKEVGAYNTIGDAKGRWQIKTTPIGAGGPYTLTVTAGDKTVTAKDILFGDVWVCSGQSNMEMGIGAVNNAAAEIAEAKNYPQLRLFHLPHNASLLTVTEVPSEAKWLVTSPENLVDYGWSGFSATGYFFGRDLQKALDIPIGLIHSSWGGTIAEAWTSEEALLASGDDLLISRTQDFIKLREEFLHGEKPYATLVREWWQENDKAIDAGWHTANFDDSSWKTMTLPTLWEKGGLPDFDGLVWFRRGVEIPAEWAGKELTVSLGPIDDCDITFFNGKEVGATSQYNTPRVYKIPAELVTAGKSTIAIGVLDSGGGGGIYGQLTQLWIRPTSADEAAAIKLIGDWKYEISGDYKELKTFPRSFDGNPNVPSVLYNGMINPFLPAAVKGAIWYQGESNAGMKNAYEKLLTTLINDWRARFTVTDNKFPFGIVMLAGFMQVATEPVQNADWPFLREAQLLTAQNVADAGVISAVDIGDAGDIHPRNKQDVGGRLARLMLHDVYGKDIVANGPVYKDFKVDGNKIILTFDNVGGGLIAKDGAPLQWFAISGEDKNFVAAKAEIVGNTVVVSADGIPTPVAVRYAWANNPDGANLYNKEGLPAFPFRTDK